MTTIDTSEFPCPLAWKLFQIQREMSGLRPNYSLALLHLIDAAELFSQLGCFLSLATISRSEREKCDKLAKQLETFLAVPLSLGHYLSIWKLAAKQMLAENRSEDRDFLSCAIFLDSDQASRKPLLDIVNELPALRNRKKGHTFAIQGEKAKEIIADWLPRLQIVLENANLFRELTICQVLDTAEPNLVEVALLVGNRSVEQCGRMILSIEGTVQQSELLVVPRSFFRMERLFNLSDVASLGPLLLARERDVFLYQGKRGSTAVYLSAASKELEDSSQVAKLRSHLSGLLITDKEQSTGPKVPAWVSDVAHATHLCEASYVDSRPNPAGFYRGAQVTWADLNANLDISCDFGLGDKEVNARTFREEMLFPTVERANRLEGPVIVLTGHAGSGKTTQLLRVGFDLHKQFGDSICVLRSDIGSPLSLDDLELAAKSCPDACVCLLIDEANSIQHQLRNDIKNALHRGIRLMVVCAERSNLWHGEIGEVFSILKPNREAIQSLVDRLEKYGLLGTLEALSPDERLIEFRERLDRQLLVALREATTGRNFDEIVLDEFRKIPSKIARDVYFLTCVMHDSDKFLSQQGAMELSGSATAKEFRDNVMAPCRDVLHSFRRSSIRGVAARHKIVASIVADKGIADLDDLVDTVLRAIVLLGIPQDGRRTIHLDEAVDLFAASKTRQALEAVEDFEIHIPILRDLGSGRKEIIKALLRRKHRPNSTLRFCAGLFCDLPPFDRNTASRLGETLSFVLIKKGLNREASEVAQATLDAGPEEPIGIVNALVESLVNQSQLKEARRVCATYIESTLESEWKNQKLYFDLSKIHEALGDPKLAIQVCHEGINRHLELGGNNSSLYMRLADLEMKYGSAGTAIEVLQNAAEVLLRSEDGETKAIGSVYHRLSMIYEKRGDIETAIETCELGLKQMQLKGYGAREVWIRLVSLHELKGELVSATTVCEQAIQYQKELGLASDELYFCLSRVLEKTSGVQAGIDACLIGIEANEIANHSLYHRLATLYESSGDFENAKSTCRKAIQRLSDEGRIIDHTFHYKLAEILQNQGDVNQAYEICEEGVVQLKEAGRLTSPIFLKKAELLNASGKTDEAIASLSTGLALEVIDREIIESALLRLRGPELAACDKFNHDFRN